MKVIFLDVDGVLNYESCWYREENRDCGTFVWDKECINQLNRIIEKTGTKIVVSSTWRLHDEHYKALTEKMNIKGEFIGKTIDFSSSHLTRGEEIQNWLDGHKDIENFIILDDEDDVGKLMPYLIKSNFKHKGLTEELADRAICLLMGDKLWL